MSNTKTNAEMLKSVKQFNRVARETRAHNLGFKSAAELITFLEGACANGFAQKTYTGPVGKTPHTPAKTSKAAVKAVAKAPVKKTKQVRAVVGKRPTGMPTIHVIDVLDSSGSMCGEKHKAAKEGINMGIQQLKSDTEPVLYTYTLCDFSDDIIFRYSISLLDNVTNFNGSTRGSTALYDAIGKSIEMIRPVMLPGDKVLVNIYTDGMENASRKFNATQIAHFIKELSEQGWTFTFIGTVGDVKYAQSNLHFHESNTLVHDNTPESLKASFAANSSARSSYSQKVSAGEDVSKGFYKDVK